MPEVSAVLYLKLALSFRIPIEVAYQRHCLGSHEVLPMLRLALL
jgi:hypothetical protein